MRRLAICFAVTCGLLLAVGLALSRISTATVFVMDLQGFSVPSENGQHSIRVDLGFRFGGVSKQSGWVNDIRGLTFVRYGEAPVIRPHELIDAATALNGVMPSEPAFFASMMKQPMRFIAEWSVLALTASLGVLAYVADRLSSAPRRIEGTV